MFRFFKNNTRISKRSLFLVSGLAWFIASFFLLSKAIYNLMSDDNVFLGEVTISIVFGILLFLFVFKRLITTHINRISNIPNDTPHILSFMDFKGYLLLIIMTALTFTLEYDELIDLDYLFIFQLSMSIPLFLCSLFFFKSWKEYPNYTEHSVR
jgi:hypothetical protein